MLGDFYAFDGNLRFATDESRKRGLCIGYTQGQTVRNFELGRWQAGKVRERVQNLLEGEVFSAQ